MDVTADTFEQEVVKSSTPVLVDFWGPACGPCLALLPQMEKLLSEDKGKVKLAKIDASKNRRLCLNLRVLGLPTFLVYQNGLEVARLTGQDLRIEQIAEAVSKIAG
jgi:thioredoxin 1